MSATRTQLTASQAAHHLRQALGEHLGRQPDDRTVAIVTAQWAHETAHGASMYNYNFGGIKGRSPSGLCVAQRTREGFGKSEVTIVDRFRAYQTPQEGALDYIGLLKTRYPNALEAAERGDPSAFVRALKARGYFTGDPAAYERSVSQIASRFTNGFVSEPTPRNTPTHRANDNVPSASQTVDGWSRGHAVPSAIHRAMETAAAARAEFALESLLAPPVPRALVEGGRTELGSDDQPSRIAADPSSPAAPDRDEPLPATELAVAPTAEAALPVTFSALTEEVTRAALRVAVAHTPSRTDPFRSDRF